MFNFASKIIKKEISIYSVLTRPKINGISQPVQTKMLESGQKVPIVVSKQTHNN